MIALKLIVPFFLSFVFIKLIIKYALKLGLTDIPNERSSHTVITPRGAGVGFGFAFFISSALFDLGLFIEYWLVYLAIFLVFLIGILDDHKDATPRAKFYVIFLATVLLFLNDIAIYNLGEYFGFELSLWYFALPFTMFALAGFTNALNLIDGLDGLSASIAIVILGSFLYIGYTHEDLLIISITFFTIVPLFAFLTLNWNPAKIFMGDSGSLFLGFVISVSAVLSLKYIHPIAVFYLAAVPIVDTLVVMTRRIRRGKSPFSPDKTHIHHILVKFFDGNVKKTVVFLSILQMVFSGIGYMMIDMISNDTHGFVPLVALLGFGMMFVIFYMIFTGIKKRQKLVDKKMGRRKNKENR